MPPCRAIMLDRYRRQARRIVPPMDARTASPSRRRPRVEEMWSHRRRSRRAGGPRPESGRCSAAPALSRGARALIQRFIASDRFDREERQASGKIGDCLVRIVGFVGGPAEGHAVALEKCTRPIAARSKGGQGVWQSELRRWRQFPGPAQIPGILGIRMRERRANALTVRRVSQCATLGARIRTRLASGH
jgi:hypothetical protein